MFGMRVGEQITIPDEISKYVIELKLLRIKPETFDNKVTFIF